MPNLVKVTGVANIVRNMSKARASAKQTLIRGLKKAGLFLQRESQQIVPVDTGNLKGSAFTREQRERGELVVLVGYTAAYAVYVHENMDSLHKPGKSAKFLERPAREHAKRITEIINEELRLS